MSGSAGDPIEWQQHIRDKSRRNRLANRFRNPEDSFQIAIVRDMWLTGFDVPFLDSMYIYKPISQHNLIQTISRVNRKFAGKYS